MKLNLATASLLSLLLIIGTVAAMTGVIASAGSLVQTPAIHPGAAMVILIAAASMLAIFITYKSHI